jgi:hypothetical protein
MKKLLCWLLLLLPLFLIAQQPFSPGSIVVVRVGVPDSALPASSSPVFLEEFAPDGKKLQTISIPYSGEDKLTLGGRSITEGILKRSSNGALLTLGGYNLEPGVSSPSSSNANAQRVIARIGQDGIPDLSVKLAYDSLYPNNAFRAVISSDGTKFWTAGGTQGVRYATVGSPSTILISNTATNLRTVNIQQGQLFISHGSGTVNTRVMKIGEGLPDTPGITATPMPGLPTSSVSGCDFFFADLDAGIAGADVLYLADDLGGLRKFSLVDGQWVPNNIVGGGSDLYRGLVGIEIPGGAVLYATKGASNQSSGGGQLVRIIDLNGYNQPMNTTVNVLAQAETFTGFRGVALAPSTSQSVQSYVFTGSGNWSNEANWQNNLKPPTELPAGNIILIKPAADAPCILDAAQTIKKGGLLIIANEKQLELNGNLIVE